MYSFFLPVRRILPARRTLERIRFASAPRRHRGSSWRYCSQATTLKVRRSAIAVDEMSLAVSISSSWASGLTSMVPSSGGVEFSAILGRGDGGTTTGRAGRIRVSSTRRSCTQVKSVLFATAHSSCRSTSVIVQRSAPIPRSSTSSPALGSQATSANAGLSTKTTPLAAYCSQVPTMRSTGTSRGVTSSSPCSGTTRTLFWRRGFPDCARTRTSSAPAATFRAYDSPSTSCSGFKSAPSRCSARRRLRRTGCICHN